MIQVSIIIPTYNRLQFIYPTILCLINQKTDLTYEIVVVDAGIDETEKIIKSLCELTKTNFVYKKILEAKNRALLRNIGAENANGEILIFLDNDMLVDSNFVQNHFDLQKKNKNSIILGKRKSLTDFDFNDFGESTLKKNFCLLDTLPWYRDVRENILNDKNLDYKTCSNQWRLLFSHNFSVNRTLFKKVKGFNEIFGENWGYEDLELGFRFFQKKYEFILDENITGYHQTHFEESKEATKQGFVNAKLFLSLHNCMEFELYGGFFNRFDDIYPDFIDIKKRIFDKKIIHKKKNTLLLGCLWSYTQNKDFEDGCLGLSLPYFEDKSFENVYIINTFYSFNFEIQCMIFWEANRLCKNPILLEKDRNTELSEITDLLQKISIRLGFQFCIEENKKEYKISLNVLQKPTYLTINLPDIFEPNIRFSFLSLVKLLEQNDYKINLIDKKGRNSIQKEYYFTNQFYELEKQFESNYGNIKSQYVTLIENESIDIVRTLNSENTILIRTEDFYTGKKFIGNRILAKFKQTPSFILQAASYLAIKNEIVMNKIMSLQKEKNRTYFTTMTDGFYEDCIDIILETISLLPDIQLKILLPNFDLNWTMNFHDHNLASKYNKSFSILNKIKTDYLQLINKINELNLQKRVTVVKENLSLIEQIGYVVNTEGFISLSRSKAFNPLIFASIILNKKVFVNENIFLENNYYESCIKIKSKKELVTTEFSLPINCNNSQLFCYKPIISDLYRKILYSDFYYKVSNVAAIEDMTKIIVEQFIQLIKSESNPAGLKVFVEH